MDAIMCILSENYLNFSKKGHFYIWKQPILHGMLIFIIRGVWDQINFVIERIDI